MERKNKITTYFVIFVFLFLCAFVSLPLFGVNTYIVKSSSMEPDIKTGSLILVEKFNSNEIFSKIHVGDDITYKVGNDTVITHRIMEINEDSDQIITKGIKNNNTGETINSSMVVGKVFLVIPFVGYIFNYYVILLLILGIIFVYIGVNLRKELVKN